MENEMETGDKQGKIGRGVPSGTFFFGGPYNKDYNICGSILGFPYLGELPYKVGFRVSYLPRMEESNGQEN